MDEQHKARSVVTPHDALVLGIDGGGSKTVAWIGRIEDGALDVVGRGEADSTNIQSRSADDVVKQFDLAIRNALHDGPSGGFHGQFDAAVIGAAGSDRESARNLIKNWVRTYVSGDLIKVVHDAEPVLAAATAEERGVALIAGTGSLAFGRSPSGQTARSGGWGYLFGDEGSGYYLGIAALRAVTMAADGRSSATSLTQSILAEFDVARPEDLVSAVYPISTDRRNIARLAPIVLDAAAGGDAVANQLVDSAAEHLVSMIDAVIRKIGGDYDTTPFALTGGLLIHHEMLRTTLIQRLLAVGAHVSRIHLVEQPVEGALRMAAKLTGKF